MKDKNTQQTLQAALKADKAVIPIEKPGERILEVNLSATAAVTDKPRIPLNLALVIDRKRRGNYEGQKHTTNFTGFAEGG